MILEMGITFLRNQVICRIFREAGYIEKLGSGFLTLFRQYRDYHLPKPKVIEGAGFVKCLLPRPGSQLPSYHLTDQEDKIMSMFDEHEFISPQLVNIAFRFSRQTTSRILSGLVKKGLLKREGGGKTTRYKIV